MHICWSDFPFSCFMAVFLLCLNNPIILFKLSESQIFLYEIAFVYPWFKTLYFVFSFINHILRFSNTSSDWFSHPLKIFRIGVIFFIFNFYCLEIILALLNSSCFLLDRWTFILININTFFVVHEHLFWILIPNIGF